MQTWHFSLKDEWKTVTNALTYTLRILQEFGFHFPNRNSFYNEKNHLVWNKKKVGGHKTLSLRDDGSHACPSVPVSLLTEAESKGKQGKEQDKTEIWLSLTPQSPFSSWDSEQMQSLCLQQHFRDIFHTLLLPTMSLCRKISSSATEWATTAFSVPPNCSCQFYWVAPRCLWWERGQQWVPSLCTHSAPVLCTWCGQEDEILEMLNSAAAQTLELSTII